MVLWLARGAAHGHHHPVTAFGRDPWFRTSRGCPGGHQGPRGVVERTRRLPVPHSPAVSAQRRACRANASRALGGFPAEAAPASRSPANFTTAKAAQLNESVASAGSEEEGEGSEQRPPVEFTAYSFIVDDVVLSDGRTAMGIPGGSGNGPLACRDGFIAFRGL